MDSSMSAPLHDTVPPSEEDRIITDIIEKYIIPEITIINSDWKHKQAKPTSKRDGADSPAYALGKFRDSKDINDETKACFFHRFHLKPMDLYHHPSELGKQMNFYHEPSLFTKWWNETFIHNMQTNESSHRHLVPPRKSRSFRANRNTRPETVNNNFTFQAPVGNVATGVDRRCDYRNAQIHHHHAQQQQQQRTPRHDTINHNNSITINNADSGTMGALTVISGPGRASIGHGTDNRIEQLQQQQLRTEQLLDPDLEGHPTNWNVGAGQQMGPYVPQGSPMDQNSPPGNLYIKMNRVELKGTNQFNQPTNASQRRRRRSGELFPSKMNGGRILEQEYDMANASPRHLPTVPSNIIFEEGFEESEISRIRGREASEYLPFVDKEGQTLLEKYSQDQARDTDENVNKQDIATEGIEKVVAGAVKGAAREEGIEETVAQKAAQKISVGKTVSRSSSDRDITKAKPTPGEEDSNSPNGSGNVSKKWSRGQMRNLSPATAVRSDSQDGADNEERKVRNDISTTVAKRISSKVSKPTVLSNIQLFTEGIDKRVGRLSNVSLQDMPLDRLVCKQQFLQVAMKLIQVASNDSEIPQEMVSLLSDFGNNILKQVHLKVNVDGERGILGEDEAKALLERFESEVDAGCGADVESIDLSGRAWTMGAIKVLEPFLKDRAPDISTLDLSDTIASLETQEGLAVYGQWNEIFAHSTSLHTLSLKDNASGGEDGVIALQSLLRMPYLRVLRLNNCGLSAVAIKQVLHLLDNSIQNLRVLDISDNCLDGEGTASVGHSLQKATKLEELSCVGTRPADGSARFVQGLREMVTVTQNHPIQKLEITSLSLGDDRSEGSPFDDIIQMLKRVNNLTHIDLTDSLSLESGETIRKLVQAIVQTSADLSCLCLGYCEITAGGVEYLAEVVEKKVGSLKELRLEGAELGFEGLQHFVKALVNTRNNAVLEELILDESSLGSSDERVTSEDVLKCLEDLGHISSLKFLSLKGHCIFQEPGNDDDDDDGNDQDEEHQQAMNEAFVKHMAENYALTVVFGDDGSSN